MAIQIVTFLAAITAAAAISFPADIVDLPYNGRTIADTCACTKTILRPRFIQKCINIPIVKQCVQTISRPILENINYRLERPIETFYPKLPCIETIYPRSRLADSVLYPRSRLIDNLELVEPVRPYNQIFENLGINPIAANYALRKIAAANFASDNLATEELSHAGVPRADLY